MSLRVLVRLLPIAALGGLLAQPGRLPAQSLQSDQANARAEMQAGRNLPIREIERLIVPRYEEQGWDYLTFEYDDAAAVYRLKFIKDGNLLFVDADARNGQILRERR